MFYLKDNFLTKDECEHLIKLWEDYRNKRVYDFNNTVLARLNHPASGDRWFADLQSYIGKKCSALADHEIVCDNIEVVQWKPGTFMRPHKDTQDICSAIVYLNDDFRGGETVIRFNDPRGQELIVEPKQGRMIVFSNGEDTGYYHWVNKIKDSNRYTLALWFIPPK
jgi:hypothetical protein